MRKISALQVVFFFGHFNAIIFVDTESEKCCFKVVNSGVVTLDYILRGVLIFYWGGGGGQNISQSSYTVV